MKCFHWNTAAQTCFEQIHDGSFFADWVKTFIFLPVGVVLLFLWLTGIWMFFEPYVKRYQRKKRRAAKAAAAEGG